MRTIKFLLSCVLGVLLIMGAWLTIRPVGAAPEEQISTQSPIYRFLDTAGDGSGTKNAIGTYTSTSFYLEPPASTVYAIDRLIVSVEDSAVTTPTLYGATTITNGIIIRRVSGSNVITLTDGISLSTNLDWRRYCEVAQATNQLQAICSFARPVRLNGDRDEKLEIFLSDDFSGLTGHYFMAQGYED